MRIPSWRFPLAALPLLQILSGLFSGLLEPSDVPSSRVTFQLTSDLADCLERENSNINITRPSDADYDERRLGANLRVDGFYPELIVNVQTVSDVQSGVQCASELDVEVVAMSGGHSYEGLSCTKGLLLRLDGFHAMLSYQVGAKEAGTRAAAEITVQSGTLLARLYGLVAENTRDEDSGMLILGGGTSAHVGTAGHVLCGGFGLFGRFLGLASDQVSAVEVVLANGALVAANEVTNPDLFWALRGGCSSAYGIVTSLTFRLTRVPTLELTMIELPLIESSTRNVTQTAQWWQGWAPIEAPPDCTMTMTFKKKGVYLKGICLLELDNIRRQVLPDLVEGLRGILTQNEIESGLWGGTFLDAALWMGGSENLTDMLATTSLEPVSARHRFKGASLQAPQAVNESAFTTLATLVENDTLDSAQFKAYGGVLRVGDGLWWNANSPLRRGYVFDVHLKKHNNCKANCEAEDEETVSSVLFAENLLAPYMWSSVLAYPGYVDLSLTNPRESYFGHENARLLGETQFLYDPNGVLRDRASSFLYFK